MTDSTASEAGIEVLVPLPIHDKARHQDPGMDKKVAKDDLLSRAPSSRSSQEPALLTPSGDDSSGSLYCPSEEPETEPGSKARKKAPAKRARPQSAPLSKVHPSRDTKADASLRRKLASADKAEASDIKPDVSTPLRVKSSPGASDGTASNSQAKTRWTDKQKFAMCMALIDAGRESADYKKIAEEINHTAQTPKKVSRVKAAFFETHRANFIKNNTDKFSYPQLSGGKIGSKDAWSTENVQSLWSGVMLAGAKAVKWAEVAEQVNEHGPARKPSDCQKTWQDTMARHFGCGKARDRKRKRS